MCYRCRGPQLASGPPHPPGGRRRPAGRPRSVRGQAAQHLGGNLCLNYATAGCGEGDRRDPPHPPQHTMHLRPSPSRTLCRLPDASHSLSRTHTRTACSLAGRSLLPLPHRRVRASECCRHIIAGRAHPGQMKLVGSRGRDGRGGVGAQGMWQTEWILRLGRVVRARVWRDAGGSAPLPTTAGCSARCDRGTATIERCAPRLPPMHRGVPCAGAWCDVCEGGGRFAPPNHSTGCTLGP